MSRASGIRPCKPGRHRPLRGFALIELIIALALSLVIVAAVGQLYSGGSMAYRLSDTLARLDENGRFAADFLANDLRMAGYLSCGGPDARVANSINGGGSWLYRTEPVEGFEGGVDTLPAELTGMTLAGTDVLIARRADIEKTTNLLQDSPSDSSMRLSPDHGFAVGEILTISDPACVQTALFGVTGLRPSNAQTPNVLDSILHAASSAIGGNCTAKLFGSFDCTTPGDAESDDYRAGSKVSPYAVSAYYITASAPPTLARLRLSYADGHPSTTSDELIRDVEDFQVLYGLDTVESFVHKVQYVTADRIADWNAVVSVRFALLMRSREPNVRTAAKALTFDLLGRSVTAAADNRLRRVFSGVVALRNNRANLP